MASDTEHCGQKQMRCAADFCRGRTPTVCAKMYTATDFCPGSISRLQRKQNRFSKGPFLGRLGSYWGAERHHGIVKPRRTGGKYVKGFLQ